MGLKEDREYFEKEMQRQRDLLKPETLRVVSHWLFDAYLDFQTPIGHKVLNNGIAPARWKGWKIYAPPLGPGCSCSIVGITGARAEQMILKGEGFDLTKGVPDGAGPDPGWSKDPATWLEEAEGSVSAVSGEEEMALEVFGEIAPIIRDTPSILQTTLYKALPQIARHDLSYALYVAAKHGRLIRKKAGNTYVLRLP